MNRSIGSWKSGKIVLAATLVAVFLALSSGIVGAQVVDRSTMTNKVMAGYQGWFAAPGDGSSQGWGHWSGTNEIGLGSYHTDIWPDVTEYDTADLYFAPNTLLTYGGTPYLWSPFDPGPVNVHFRWMQENGIDGAFLQRFIVECQGPSTPSQIHRDTVLQNVMNAATTYGRTFAVEYDTSSGNDAYLFADLTEDWTYLCNTFNVKNHSRYQYHNGKPVVIIWGVGVGDRPGTPAIHQQILDWFQANGCFVMAGTPGGWRTDSNYYDVYRNFDGITPWTVGGYNSWDMINAYKNDVVIADIAECNAYGMLFMTTAWPRFQWDNMNGDPCGTSYFSPRGGQHLWDQMYAFKSAGVHCQFIAMMDEYCEGTAIMKCTDNVPVGACWLTTDGLGNDWFLRLTNQGGRMQRGEIATSQTMPINSATIPDGAQIMSNTIPATMTAGQPYSVNIVIKNIGETAWNADMFRLGVGGDYDPFYTSSNRIFMNTGEMIAPNAQKTFTFTMTAPTTNGTYKSDWQMVHEKIRWFGDYMAKQVRVGGTDTTAPAVVTNFVRTAGDRQVSLSWTNPTTADYTGTMIRFRTNAYPTGPTNGTLVCDRATAPGLNDSFVHTGLTNGATYYYAVYTYDYTPTYSASVTGTAVPANITAPGPASNFRATANGGANVLSWTNPTDPDFAGMRIVFKTTGYPTSATDGTVAYSGTGTGSTHGGLTNGTVYYYAAYAFDSVPNYSTASLAASAPSAGACFSDTIPYGNGSLVGNNGWTGAANNQIEVVNQTVKINGEATTWDVWRNVTCNPNPQNIITATAKIQSGTGIENMWSIWIDDSQGFNLARWYGSGTTARGRIGVTSNVTSTQNLTGGWDTLKVKIDTAANTTEFFFNSVSLGALDHSVTGAGNSVAKIRLNRMSNSAAAGTYVYLDDLRAGDLDTTPPGPVTNFTATPGNTQNTLNWTNPGSDYTGTMIRFSTAGYPGSPTGGTQCYNGNGTSTIHTGLTNGVTYYYTAFAYDGVPNYSTGAAASAVPTASACFTDAFAYSNGNLNGNGSWSGSATSQIQITGQTVQINGGATSYDAIRTVSCGDPGVGYMTVTCKVNGEVGADTMWNLWIDDPAGLNLARWYGSGTTARGRIAGTGTVTATQTLTGGWDTLKVQINPTTNSSEFFFNGASIGALDHGQTGAGNTIGRLRFERENNSPATGQYLFFDDLSINDATPPDVTPPGPVTSFIATSGDTQNSLSWVNPGSDYTGTLIRFKTTGYPTGPTDGTQVYDSNGTSTTHTGLTNGVTYYYSAWAHDAVPNYSTKADASAVPADVTPPGPVTGFTATPGNTQNGLSWTNPTGDFTGTIVRFKTTGYPTGPTDGTSCYQGTGTSYTHTGLTNGVVYYYCAYAYDEVPNYSAAAQASATPAVPLCFSDYFAYADGALNGYGGWSGSATSAHIAIVGQTVKIIGGSSSKDAIKTVSCGDQGAGYAWVKLKVQKGSGANTSWNLWINDSQGRNFARWYGSGSTARGRIGTTGTVTNTQNLTAVGTWDNCDVKITFAAQTAEFFFNSTSIGSLSYSSQSATSPIAQLRFEKENNAGANGEYAFFDNLTIGGT